MAHACRHRRCSTIWKAARRLIGSWISFRPSRERRPLPPWISPDSPPWPVRVLLDENLPRDLVTELTAHDVTTVQAAGWSGIDNGKLLRRAHGRFDVLLTMDRGLRYQQSLKTSQLSILIIRARSNRMIHLKPLVDGILMALEDLRPGELREIGV